MNELKPCPACGGPVVIDGGIDWHNKDRFFICCKNPECGCCRVGDTVREQCIERWNALPRALTWSNAPPKIDGFYWWDCEQENIGTPTMVHVSVYDGYLHFMTLTFGDGSPFFHECEKCRWAGPITEPQEPKP